MDLGDQIPPVALLLLLMRIPNANVILPQLCGFMFAFLVASICRRITVIPIDCQELIFEVEKLGLKGKKAVGVQPGEAAENLQGGFRAKKTDKLRGSRAKGVD